MKHFNGFNSDFRVHNIEKDSKKIDMTSFFKVKGYISVNQVPGKVLKKNPEFTVNILSSGMQVEYSEYITSTKVLGQ